ncbi:MAG: hypothetical protein R6V73_00790 [Anaerolineales bacterium]
MRRILMILAILMVLGLISCRAAGLLPVINPQADSRLTATLASPTFTLVEATPTATSTPVLTPTLRPSPSPTKEPSPTSSPSSSFTVRYHPDQALYVGDQVSWEVFPSAEMDLSGHAVTVWVDDQRENPFGPLEFSPFGIQGRMQATFTWAWDTSELEPGSYTLTYSVDPSGFQWTETLFLHPQSALLPPEPKAQWAVAESDCCVIYYISGTEAERDLDRLLNQMDDVAQSVAQRMGAPLEEPVTVTLLPRVLGHGGFASDGISVSYLDRNYAGSYVEMVLHHEMVHILDSRLGGELRPTILVEGLAVYLSGGHFKPEAILPRAAALLLLADNDSGRELGWYKELGPLADNFYPAQHEIGYLQAAALVEFMIQTWGWDAFMDFYRDIQPHPSGSQAQAMQAALLKHFEISLAELEQVFLDELRRQEVTPEHVQDVRLTVEYYDSVRRYQQQLDPSAYFMTAWLVDRREMQERGIVADYVRRPTAAENILLEEMLVDAHQRLISGDYSGTELALGNISAALDALLAGIPWGGSGAGE